MMTKKHYVAIASEIHFAKDRGANAHSIIAHRLAEYFASENPRFDSNRFLEACGVENYPQCNTCKAHTAHTDDGQCINCIATS